MIEVQCTCGVLLEVASENIAEGVVCPKCGASVAELLAKAKAREDAERVVIACIYHPDRAAAGNCQNCSKPLCADCIHENGYYCSAACKEAVLAREPVTVQDEAERVAIQKAQRTANLLATVTKIGFLLAALALLGGIGYSVYQKKFGPHPQITASLGVDSQIATFKAQRVEPDVIVGQTNDDIFAAKLSTQQQIWSASLGALEEKVETKPVSRLLETPAYPSGFDSPPPRDRLHLVGVKSGNVIVRSDRQLLAFDDKNGQLRWKFFNPQIKIERLELHESGALCLITQAKTSPRVVSFSFADGSESWSFNDAMGITDIAVRGDRAILLRLGPSAKGSDASAAADSAGVPPGNYLVQFRALADGSGLGQSTAKMLGETKLMEAAPLLCLATGQEISVFGQTAEPLWKATLPAEPILVATSGGIFAAATNDKVIALDAKSGQQKWSRSGIRPMNLLVDPDGAVYATIDFPESAAWQSEMEKFRFATVGTAGAVAPGGGFPVLLKLDPQSGKTLWGVKNIGREPLFWGQNLYTCDTLSWTDAKLGYDEIVSHYSLRQISPRNGKDIWNFSKKGFLYDHEFADGGYFMATADTEPAGRKIKTSHYFLQALEYKK